MCDKKTIYTDGIHLVAIIEGGKIIKLGWLAMPKYGFISFTNRIG